MFADPEDLDDDYVAFLAVQKELMSNGKTDTGTKLIMLLNFIQSLNTEDIRNLNEASERAYNRVADDIK